MKGVPSLEDRVRGGVVCVAIEKIDLTRDPSEIGCHIVPRIAVNVVNFRMSVRVGDKGFRDEAVNSKCDAPSILSDANLPVSSRMCSKGEVLDLPKA